MRRSRLVLLLVLLAAMPAVLQRPPWRGTALHVAPEPAAADPSGATTPKPPPRFGVERLIGPARRESVGRVVVHFDDDASRRQRAATVRRVDGTVEQTIAPLDVKVVDVPDAKVTQAAATLERSPAVEEAEPDAVVRATRLSNPNDALWPNQWGWRLVGIPTAWSALADDSGVVVAVLDSGADFTHPDLQGAFVPGRDLVNGDDDPSDDNGHGTAVAGIVAARADNAEGGAGVCFDCSIMPVKVLGADGLGTASTVAAGILWAVDHGARVISLSLGTPIATQVLADAVAYAVSKDVLVVAAAGNNGTTTPFYPAAYDGVVSVGGTTATDTLYPWSNRGGWVRVAAPGCNLAPARGGSYEDFCGTSSATPLVAGLAGLALSLDPHASESAVESALLHAGPRVPGVEYGRVDTAELLAALGVAPPPTPVRRVTTVVGSWRRTVPRTGHPLRLGRVVAAGRLTVSLEPRSSRRVAVAVVDGRGRTIARRAGTHRLRFGARVAAGRVSFLVRGAPGARFRLTVLRSTPEATS